MLGEVSADVALAKAGLESVVAKDAAATNGAFPHASARPTSCTTAAPCSAATQRSPLCHRASAGDAARKAAKDAVQDMAAAQAAGDLAQSSRSGAQASLNEAAAARKAALQVRTLSLLRLSCDSRHRACSAALGDSLARHPPSQAAAEKAQAEMAAKQAAAKRQAAEKEVAGRAKAATDAEQEAAKQKGERRHSPHPSHSYLRPWWTHVKRAAPTPLCAPLTTSPAHLPLTTDRAARDTCARAALAAKLASQAQVLQQRLADAELEARAVGELVQAQRLEVERARGELQGAQAVAQEQAGVDQAARAKVAAAEEGAARLLLVAVPSRSLPLRQTPASTLRKGVVSHGG